MNMKHLKHKKIVFVGLGVVALLVISLYAWVGAYVLQVFPRNEPQDTTAETHALQTNKPPAGTANRQTLGEVSEKPVPQTPTPAPSTQADTQNTSKKPVSADQKPTNNRRKINILGWEF